MTETPVTSHVGLITAMVKEVSQPIAHITADDHSRGVWLKRVMWFSVHTPVMHITVCLNTKLTIYMVICE